MPDRPQGLLSSAPSEVGATKCPPPQAHGKGSGCSLASMSLPELNGIASTAFDPMRGRILSESDPRAQALLAENAKRVAAAQAGKKKLPTWVRGQHVFHARRKEYGFISAAAEGKRIEVTFSKGKALVQIANLQKV